MSLTRNSYAFIDFKWLYLAEENSGFAIRYVNAKSKNLLLQLPVSKEKPKTMLIRYKRFGWLMQAI